jgi:signal peptidase complex subunit 2
MVSDFGFVENHWHSDVKLLLGYSACAFALFATVYSYFIPFPACKSVLLIGVIGYVNDD